ncbi:glutamate 5-kinase [Vaginisenegalia massiliensis]|uniref:glutamate 5-kinase n=1 Tax=Vaginisenegalia massiliensis TaxID=2058294 RepID=UPI000F52717E|nr:glutamate 5-kinase [Vaginisenegalia massiliensis]
MSREKLKSLKRIVIKIGTNSIMRPGQQVDFRKLDRIAFVCSSLQQEGYEVILVSSGAVGVGAAMLKVSDYPKEISEQQALASVGQGALMNLYSRFFRAYQQFVGQILITRDVVDFPSSKYNCQTAINTLLKKGIIPIINENDAISVDEMNHQTKFGDNDTLSAIVARLIEADLLVIMSDVDGLYDKNPKLHSDAELLDHISAITPEVLAMAGGSGSTFATGGMETKLRAAELILANQQAMIITSAADPTVLFDIVAGEKVGTLFSQV